MKQKIPPAALYVITALAVAGYFDALYGAAPVTHRQTPIHFAIAGTIIFAIACLLSLFSLRLGAVGGLVGACLSWPFFGPILIHFPWTKLPEVLPYAMWADSLAALVTLIVATVYSVCSVSSTFRRRASR